MMTHPMLNISSTGSSGCSQVDRFSKHFEKCRDRESHVKASVFLPNIYLLKYSFENCDSKEMQEYSSICRCCVEYH